jgi:tetratricopeptide (TPR) repeat protein
MNRANIYIARRQWDAAVADSSKAIDMWIPELAARARAVRASAYYMLRELDKAKADLDEAQKIDADDPNSYLVRGNIDYDENRYAAAARNFEQYCKLRPDDPAGFIGRGMALEADSRFEEALHAYETAIRLDPTDPRAIFGRERAKSRQQPCDSSLCWNQPKKMPGWPDTIEPR